MTSEVWTLCSKNLPTSPRERDRMSAKKQRVRPGRTAAEVDRKHRHLETTEQVKIWEPDGLPTNSKCSCNYFSTTERNLVFKTYIFASGYYKEKSVPVRWPLVGKSGGGHTTSRCLQGSHAWPMKTVCRNNDTFTEANWKGALRTFPTTLNFWIALPLGKSSVIHKQTDSQGDLVR